MNYIGIYDQHSLGILYIVSDYNQACMQLKQGEHAKYILTMYTSIVWRCQSIIYRLHNASRYLCLVCMYVYGCFQLANTQIIIMEYVCAVCLVICDTCAAGIIAQLHLSHHKMNKRIQLNCAALHVLYIFCAPHAML